MELTDKVAIVTGSGRGIGKGIAKILAKDGAKIIVADMNLDDALKVASEIDDLGSSGTPLRVDVTVQEAVDSMVESAQHSNMGATMQVLLRLLAGKTEMTTVTKTGT